jgi:internalin A
MATGSRSAVLDQLRSSAFLQDGGATDGQLLEQFLAHHDQDAFAALLRRHGPMVWAVCRRLLGNVQDAEDAFQATFLVLARKAATIRQREAVGSWLHGAAYRAALEARAARQRFREKQVSAMPEHQVFDQPAEWSDVRPLLDKALAELPEKYRTALILCDLEGRSRRQAARRIGIPEGTLSSRLATGRRLLAQRLSRHGLILSSAALAAQLVQNAAVAGMPPAWPVRTIHVTILAERVVHVWWLGKLRRTVFVLLVLAGLVAGAAMLAWPAPLAEQPLSSSPTRPKPNLSASAPSGKQTDTPEPAVIAAWENAGAEFGWLGSDDAGWWRFSAARVTDRESVPCFFLPAWPQAGVKTLPAPKVPFAVKIAPKLPAADAQLRELGGFGQLRTLDLGETAVTDAGLKELAALKQLQTLILYQTQVTDAGLKELAALKQLQTLNLYLATQITDAAVKELVRLEQLQALNLGATQVTNAGLKELAALKRLRLLVLSYLPVTDAELKQLAGLEQLHTLLLGNTQVTDAGVKELARLKQLEVVHLRFAPVTDACLPELAKLPRLKRLDLFHTPVTNAGLKNLAACPQLRMLDLGNTQVTDAGLKSLAKLQQLRELYFDSTPITDTGLKELAGLEQMRTLDLGATAVTDAGLKHLAGLKSLETLVLLETKVTDTGLKEMAKLKHLHVLDLAMTRITDVGLRELAGLQ